MNDQIKTNGSLCAASDHPEEEQCPFIRNPGYYNGYEHVYWCEKFKVWLQVGIMPSTFPKPIRWVQCFWDDSE